MSRLHCTTQKVQTKFGNLFVHVAHDTKGRILGIDISAPGKFSDTTMGEVLDSLSEALTEVAAGLLA
jgi:hypothetical protein